MSKRKKRGKKITPAKPRTREVLIDLGSDMPIDEFRMYLDGRVEFRHKGVPYVPAQAHTQISYDRPKGPKIQSRASVEGSRLSSHPNQALEAADRVFWIDTSSNDYLGDRLHTTATVLAEPYGRTATHVLYRFGRAQGLEFGGLLERPEAFAWAEIIERIRQNPSLPPSRQICLVVDSDLELLTQINARTLPVWREYILPPNFSLVYASADIGKSDPLNSMMAFCDAESRRLFEVVSGTDKLSLCTKEHSVVGGPHVRVWQPTDPPAA